MTKFARITRITTASLLVGFALTSCSPASYPENQDADNLVSQQAQAEPVEEMSSDDVRTLELAYNSLKLDYDKIDDFATWRHSADGAQSGTRVSSFIAGNMDSSRLVLQLDYEGEDQIFLSWATIYIDGNTQDIWFKPDAVTDSNSQGIVRERALYFLESPTVVYQMSESEETIIRLRGSGGQIDITLDARDKARLVDIARGFEYISYVGGDNLLSRE